MATKPQLLIQDLQTAGKHNGAIEQTRIRLDKSKHWTKQRIIVLLPTAEMIAAKVALSHWNLQFPPNNGVVRMLAIGMEVGEAYSTAIEQILAHPELSTWEYLLTLESDNLCPSDGVLKLLESMEANKKYSAISALYFVKGENSPAQIWGDINDPSGINFRPQLPDPNGGLVECCGIGMGMSLFRLKMFKDKKLRKPWFVTQKDASGCATQDLFFWQDARKHGYRCAVDCSVKSGHFDVINNFAW